jgi:uncharacterized membrane protein YeaQ/YmgE (transglycosylase-associated protein family)
MLRAFASHCWLTGGTTAIDNLPCKGFAMLWAILIGFIVGLVAKFLTPGRDPSGFFITAAIGIVGSLLATYGGQALGLYNAGEPGRFHRLGGRRSHRSCHLSLGHPQVGDYRLIPAAIKA